MTDKEHAPDRSQWAPAEWGEFTDGPDSILWNPQLSRARWRREQIRAALGPGGGRHAVGCAGFLGLMAAGIAQLPGGVAIAIGLGTAVIGVIVRGVRFRTRRTEHRHPTWQQCRLERRIGEFFFRSRDFADLGSPVFDTVIALIDTVIALHTTPARAWLDSAVPREVHALVWDALVSVHRTRSARHLAAQLAADPAAADLSAAAADAVAVADRALAEVLWHLRGCVVLSQAWEAKLRHADLAARTDDALAALRECRIGQVAAAAEPLPQSVFAYLTAARDVTGSGPFPWENPQRNGEVIGGSPQGWAVVPSRNQAADAPPQELG